MFKDRVKSIFNNFTQKKPIVDSSESKLAKVLNAFDLTALGIGSTLGVGVYVLAGEVSKYYAGPAVVISFLIAAIASILAGLCYAEFGARVPKAGSAYIYSYVTIGEFIAFLIGWNLILEYAIGSASVVKGLSTYTDSLFNYAMRDFFTDHMPMNVSGFSSYPDFFAFGVTIIFSLAIGFGAKESTIVNNIFTMLNLAVVLFVFISGLFHVQASNWNIPASEVPEEAGTGGFAPFGFSGIIRGAAVCFYGFIGFDVIATAGEEARNPRKSIPFAVIVSLLCIFLAYFGVSAVLTMMLPYYDQDAEAPLPYVFRHYGMNISAYVVSVGALFGLCASLMGAMFPLPRIIYAMSSDGLLFKFMGQIHPRFQTPLYGTLLAGLIVACLAAIFNLNQLVSMMSIGTLLAYSMVAGCVLLLRYECDVLVQKPVVTTVWRQLLNLDKLTVPTRMSSKITKWAITLFGAFCFPFGLSINIYKDATHDVTSLDYILTGIALIPIVLLLIVIVRQPTSTALTSFKVPFVPFLPAISIIINTYLMINLDYMTWVRFAVWMLIGLIIYIFYGMHHSVLRRAQAVSTENILTASISTISTATCPEEATNHESLDSKNLE